MKWLEERPKEYVMKYVYLEFTLFTVEIVRKEDQSLE